MFMKMKAGSNSNNSAKKYNALHSPVGENMQCGLQLPDEMQSPVPREFATRGEHLQQWDTCLFAGVNGCGVPYAGLHLADVCATQEEHG